MMERRGVLHFTGIGGAGMSGLAEIMHQLGYAVHGSDARLSAVTERLARLGLVIHAGHAAANLAEDAQALVVTSAVNETNPELVEARRRGLPVLLRGELLAELMRARRGVAIAGSHGKTTTSTLLTTILLHAGLDPTAVVGGSVPAMNGANARLGASDLLVCESDESDGSFLLLTPRYGAITNIDHEHMEHYGGFAGVRAAFLEFANHVSFEGALALCVDDAEASALQPRIRRRVLSYGRSDAARLRVTRGAATAEGIQFELAFDGQPLGAFAAPVLGEHNILNATAAIGLALELGVEVNAIRAALAGARGPGRRMEHRGVARGVTVIDDYGHHPSEIRATLKALRPAVGAGRLYVLFQPHRYSRTLALMDEFTTCFDDADVVRIVDLYAASEEPLEGIDSMVLAERVRARSHADVRYAGSIEAAAAMAAEETRAGDTVLTLGAGSITQAGPMVLEALKRRREDG
jgi:UDP-N-acetylmuramate--alanine ligase